MQFIIQRDANRFAILSQSMLHIALGARFMLHEAEKQNTNRVNGLSSDMVHCEVFCYRPANKSWW